MLTPVVPAIPLPTVVERSRIAGGRVVTLTWPPARTKRFRQGTLTSGSSRRVAADTVTGLL